MLSSTSIFFVLLTYAIYNQNPRFSIFVWAVVVDVVLNFYNLYLNLKPSDSFGKRLHEFLPEVVRGLAVGFFLAYEYWEKKEIFVYLTLVYIFPVVYRLFSCTKYGKSRFLGELTEAVLYLCAYLFMNKLLLNKSLSFTACIAPVFYFTVALAVLRLCLLVKALYYIFANIFKCCSGSSLKGKLRLKQDSKFF